MQRRRRLELLLIKPEEMEKGSVHTFSEQIINGLRKEKELAVVGVGNAMSLACKAVQRSSNISKVAIDELSLDYLGSPTLGLGGVFFILNKESRKNWDSEKEKIEKKMKLNFEPDGQLVVVTKNLMMEKIIPLCLSKLSQSEALKISATGTTINRAVLVALELTRGDIAKDVWGIELVALSTVKFPAPAGESSVLETAIDIFIRKNLKISYSEKHRQIIKLLQ
jgi:DNA-binding protein